MLQGFVLAFAVVALTSSPVAAQTDEYNGKPPPKVGGVEVGKPPQVGGTSGTEGTEGARVLSASQSRAVAFDGRTGGGLAVTGGDVLQLTVIGLAALGTGSALVLQGRRRRAT